MRGIQGRKLVFRALKNIFITFTDYMNFPLHRRNNLKFGSLKRFLFQISLELSIIFILI